ncbi:MAG TPA: hypothetical protein VHT51_21045 [Micropepsaceae bacterium]|jgi:hypothetical protein|nr:hypothetical protein [Micropepsaceae bacterium]
MSGRKTHEQFTRNLERKPGIDDPIAPPKPKQPDRGARESELPVSQRGMNQESEHNKHNNPPQGAAKH